MRIKTETTVGIFILLSICGFLFMTFQVGFFRFDKIKYTPYIAQFKDVTGLIKKADVKIAGVKVGWVDSIDLDESNKSVKAKLMILKQCILHSDAHAFVKQDGLFGIRFVEIIPGKNKSILAPNSILESDDRDQVCVEDLLYKFSKIADDIKTISNSLKNSITNQEAIDQLKNSINVFNNTAIKIAQVSENVNMLISKLTDQCLPQFEHEIKNITLAITKNTTHLKDDFLPKIANNADKFIETFKESSESVKKTAEQINQVMQVINNGDTVNNCKTVIDQVQFCCQKAQCFQYGLDNFYEFQLNKSKNELVSSDLCKNFKTHLNFWFHPDNCYYFLAGFTFSKNGFFSKKITRGAPRSSLPEAKIDSCLNNQVSNQERESQFEKKNFELDHKFLIINKTNKFSLNLQAGAYVLNNLGLRFGIFETTPGIALDYLVPIYPNWLRIVGSFEIFDFTGKNHLLNDSKPHLKWINRFYFSPNFYIAFGADDFASKFSKSAFIGFGLNFGDTYFTRLFCR